MVQLRWQGFSQQLMTLFSGLGSAFTKTNFIRAFFQFLSGSSAGHPIPANDPAYCALQSSKSNDSSLATRDRFFLFRLLGFTFSELTNEDSRCVLYCIVLY